jgi:hypothetical protein
MSNRRKQPRGRLSRERRVRADGGGEQVLAEVEPDVVPGEPIRKKWWTERGSGLCINDQEGLEAVIFYVREAQDRVGELEREHVPREPLRRWLGLSINVVARFAVAKVSIVTRRHPGRGAPYQPLRLRSGRAEARPRGPV